jgi:hypothetical protein
VARGFAPALRALVAQSAWAVPERQAVPAGRAVWSAEQRSLGAARVLARFVN